jgi:hypothetical protein
LQQDLSRLKGRWERVSERADRLTSALDIETDPLRRYQYEQQLAASEEERSRIGEQLNQLERQLQDQGGT